MSTRRTLAVGLIGYKFMGKAHSNGWRQAPHFFDLPADLRLKTICGRDQAAAKRAAAQFGWENAETDWRRVIDDPGIDIIDICDCRSPSRQSNSVRETARAKCSRSGNDVARGEKRARGQHGVP